MMETKSRKGFKFTVKSKDVRTENIDFDDVERSDDIAAKNLPVETAEVTSSNHTGLGDSLKKRRDSSVLENDEAKKAKIAESVVARGARTAKLDEADKLKAERKIKFHYPKIEINDRAYVFNKKPVGVPANGKAQVVELVSTICNFEAGELEKLLSGGHEAEFLPMLVEVLEDIPKVLSEECPDDCSFEPELTEDVMVDTKRLRSRLVELQALVGRLEKFDREPALFLKEFSVETAPAPAAATLAAEAQKNDKTSAVRGMSKQYENLLDELESNLDNVLEYVREAEKLMTSAKQSQEAMYHAFQKLRYQRSGAKTSNNAGGARKSATPAAAREAQSLSHLATSSSSNNSKLTTTTIPRGRSSRQTERDARPIIKKLQNI